MLQSGTKCGNLSVGWGWNHSREQIQTLLEAIYLRFLKNIAPFVVKMSRFTVETSGARERKSSEAPQIASSPVFSTHTHFTLHSWYMTRLDRRSSVISNDLRGKRKDAWWGTAASWDKTISSPTTCQMTTNWLNSQNEKTLTCSSPQGSHLSESKLKKPMWREKKKSASRDVTKGINTSIWLSLAGTLLLSPSHIWNLFFVGGCKHRVKSAAFEWTALWVILVVPSQFLKDKWSYFNWMEN